MPPSSLRCLAACSAIAASAAALLILSCSKETPTSPTADLPVCPEPGPSPLFMYSWPQTPCPTRDDIEAIRREIPITFDNPPSSPVVCGSDVDSVELTHYEERLFSGLAFMRSVQFSVPLPWTDLSLYDWFRNAVRGIVVETGEWSYCCDPAKVIHIGLKQQKDTHTWRRTADTLKVSGLVHEARHADTHIPHTCPTNQSQDARVSDLGAYGVQYLSMVWIAEYSNASAEMKEYNRWAAKVLRLNAFCLECANANSQARVVLPMRRPWFLRGEAVAGCNAS